MTETKIEPWLRGTQTEVEAVTRGVLHALELAGEDIVRWCGGLTDVEVNERPWGLPPIAFHLRHIARSLDRLLTYAEGAQLSREQLEALKTEMDAGATAAMIMEEVSRGLAEASSRVELCGEGDLQQARRVGRKGLPTSVGGLLVHAADHTQRHVGQAITTAKVLLAQR